MYVSPGNTLVILTTSSIYKTLLLNAVESTSTGKLRFNSHVLGTIAVIMHLIIPVIANLVVAKKVVEFFPSLPCGIFSE